MAEGDYGGFSRCFGQRFHEDHRLARAWVLRRALARRSPGVLGRDVCPQKYKQDSHDYVASGQRDVRRPCPAPPLLVHLQGHIAHDVPLALLAVYSCYGSTVPPNSGYVLG